jgi:hypothetical protein
MFSLLLILFLFVLYLYLYKKEGLTGSPQEVVQSQQGTIVSLRKQIAGITFTESSIDALQSENDTMTDQINKLQENLPDKQVKMYT